MEGCENIRLQFEFEFQTQPLIASLRRQNADLKVYIAFLNEKLRFKHLLKMQKIFHLINQLLYLKAKLADAKVGNKRTSENLNSIDKLLIEQKEGECDELKKTVSNLEKLLELEREERTAYEKNTMGLLEDVKKKWHDR